MKYTKTYRKDLINLIYDTKKRITNGEITLIPRLKLYQLEVRTLLPLSCENFARVARSEKKQFITWNPIVTFVEPDKSQD